MSPSVVSHAVKHAATNAVVVTVKAHVRCIPWSAPNAAMMPQYRSYPVAIVLFTAVTASAGRVADQAAADATKPMNSRALIRHQSKQ